MTADTRPKIERHYRNVVMDSARWEQFQPRTDDIVISTSYKAGTTWLQGICAALVFQALEPPLPQDDLSPWLDALFAPIDEVVSLLDAGKMAPGATTGLWKDNARFFHKGTSRRWEKLLSPDQSDRYEQIAAERLEPALANWLEHGRAVAGDPTQL